MKYFTWTEKHIGRLVINSNSSVDIQAAENGSAMILLTGGRKSSFLSVKEDDCGVTVDVTSATGVVTLGIPADTIIDEMIVNVTGFQHEVFVCEDEFANPVVNNLVVNSEGFVNIQSQAMKSLSAVTRKCGVTLTLSEDLTLDIHATNRKVVSVNENGFKVFYK